MTKDEAPYKGLSEHLAQATNGRIRIDPVTGDVGIGTPAAPDLQAELDATNRQVEILSDALAESRREVAALKAVQECLAHGECFGGKCIYTTPPVAKRQWVGLTDEERMDILLNLNWDKKLSHMDTALTIEAKLRSKNDPTTRSLAAG
jgi:hypothetical protein